MSASHARALEGRRVLIVEDDALFALEMTEILAEIGCTIVDVAAGLSRGLAAAEFHELDLAVVDINLGEETSYRVAHMLMARDVPFVFATGARPEAIPPEFARVPALTKPFSAQTLQTLLVDMVSGSA